MSYHGVFLPDPENDEALWFTVEEFHAAFRFAYDDETARDRAERTGAPNPDGPPRVLSASTVDLLMMVSEDLAIRIAKLYGLTIAEVTARRKYLLENQSEIRSAKIVGL